MHVNCMCYKRAAPLFSASILIIATLVTAPHTVADRLLVYVAPHASPADPHRFGASLKSVIAQALREALPAPLPRPGMLPAAAGAVRSTARPPSRAVSVVSCLSSRAVGAASTAMSEPSAAAPTSELPSSSSAALQFQVGMGVRLL